MNVQIALPAHVGEDGVWIHFTSPTTGKQSMVNMDALLEKMGGGIIGAAMSEWNDAQRALHRLHNPIPPSADLPR